MGDRTVEWVDATKARAEFAEITNSVAYGKSRVVIERRGKGVAAVVSMEDLERLEALDDAKDLRLARRALKEPGIVSLKEAKKRLGIK